MKSLPDNRLGEAGIPLEIYLDSTNLLHEWVAEVTHMLSRVLCLSLKIRKLLSFDFLLPLVVWVGLLVGHQLSIFVIAGIALAVNLVFWQALGLIGYSLNENWLEQDVGKRMQRSTLVPVVISVFAVAIYLAGAAITGKEFTEDLEISKLAAMTYLLGSIIWMLLVFVRLDDADAQQVGDLIKKNETTLVNIVLITFVALFEEFLLFIISKF